MKKILVPLLLTASFSAYAAGPLDGIYSCAVKLATLSTNIFLTINGQPSGTSVYAVVATSSNSTIHGYGIGTATSTSFSGTTNEGLPFSFSVAPQSQNLNGEAGAFSDCVRITATANCLKIF